MRGFICAIIKRRWYRCQLSLDTARYSAFFLLTCTLKNRPSVHSSQGVASGLLVSAADTAEKHRCGGNGRVLKAFAGTLIYNEGDHPFKDGVLSSGWGWSALIRWPQW